MSATPIDLGDWRFKAWGQVEEEVAWSWAELEELARTELDDGVDCASGSHRIAGRWSGVPTRELLARVRLKPDAAFVIATTSGGDLYYEWTAFDLAFRDLSPGRLLAKHVIEEAGRDGFQSLDFGQGDAAYKRFWATDHHFVHRIAAARRPAGCSALLFYRALWSLPPTGRVLRSYRALRRLGRRMAQARISTTSTDRRTGRA